MHLASSLLAHGLDAAPTRAARVALCQAYQQCLRHVATFLGQRTSSGAHSGSSDYSSSSSDDSSEEEQTATDPDTGADSAAGRDGSCTASSSGSSCDDAGSGMMFPSWPRSRRRCMRHAHVSPAISLAGAGASAYVALARGVIGSKPVSAVSM